MAVPPGGRSTRAFDLIMVGLCAVLVAGGHLVVWADERELIEGNQLFSVWALPVYVGFLPAAYLLLLWWTGRRAGPRGVPAGYRAALVGAALFLLGLAADFFWRSVAGRPALGEAVLAPSRILLFVGGALLISGPLASTASRLSAAVRPRRVLSVDGVAFAVAIGLLMAVGTLMTGFVHPFVVLAGAPIEQPARPPTDLYLVPLDGSGSQRLTVTPDEWETHPAVAPDGSRIAFDRGSLDDQRAFVAALDGSGATRLTDRTTDEESPIWAPDGSRLAVWAPFPRPQPSSTPTPQPAGPGPGPSPRPAAVDFSGLAIWIITPGDGPGTPLRQVAGEGAESWSPDGTKLCGWTLAGGKFDVATWDVATGAMTRVTSTPGDDWSCDWSPDGSRLLFNTDRDGNWEIYSTDPSGGDPRRLTNDAAVDQLARWSPDGQHIAFMSNRGGDPDVWLAGADGSAPRNLTNDPALDDGVWGIAWLADGSGLIAASGGRSDPAPAASETVPLGVGSIALNALIVAGALLVALRLAGPVVGVGSIAGLVGGLLAGLTGAEPLLFIAVVAAGAAADLAAWDWSRGTGRFSAVAVGVAATVSLVVAYFVVLWLTRGVGWGLDLVVGSVCLAGVLGAALGYIALDRPHQSGATIS